MSTWATPGRRCVCINDDWREASDLRPIWSASPRVPMITEVLTIKEVIDDHPLKAAIPGGIALTFHELGTDDCFSITHFADLAPMEPEDPDNLDFESAYDG